MGALGVDSRAPGQQQGDREPHLQLRGISKRFGNARALIDVDLTVMPGTIHAVVGENGAGKSTLGKVVAGLHRPDAGRIVLAGEEIQVRNPREALDRGIAMTAQELLLAPQLTVIQNVFLGIEPRVAGLERRRAIRDRYARLVAQTGFDLPADARVGSLRVAEQQTVEIMRAIAREVRLLIMDEPTAALARDQAERLFGVLRSFRERGITVLYVSHFLGEVLALANAITVMRNGEVVSTKPASEQTHNGLVAEMLGAPVDVTFPSKAFPPDDAPVVARARGLRRAPAVVDVSFEVRRGEILGIAGLVGSGRTETARLLFGADRGQGSIELHGRPVKIRRPRDAMRLGIGLVPESRKDEGLLLQRSIVENVTLADLRAVSKLGVISRRRALDAALEAMERIDVRSSGPAALVESLSGGNQQKVLFGRWLLKRPNLLIVDEPTRGVDVGAKRAIYELLHELAARGTAIVAISSEIEEVIGIAHRVIVMSMGSIVGEFHGKEVTEREILSRIFMRTANPGDGSR
jgi:simple sugar transport system ATP-binding protein/ribose transport system ATP-binding protein